MKGLLNISSFPLSRILIYNILFQRRVPLKRRKSEKKKIMRKWKDNVLCLPLFCSCYRGILFLAWWFLDGISTSWELWWKLDKLLWLYRLLPTCLYYHSFCWILFHQAKNLFLFIQVFQNTVYCRFQSLLHLWGSDILWLFSSIFLALGLE